MIAERRRPTLLFSLRIFLLAIGFVSSTLALSPVSYGDAVGPLVSIGTEDLLRYEDDGHNFEVKHPWSIRAGYAFDDFDTYLDYSNFRTMDGVASISVADTHEEYVAWARKTFYESWFFRPYAALGVGLSIDSVDTTYGGSTSHATGHAQMIMDAATGFSRMIYRGLELQLELKFNVAASNAPNPEPSLGLYLGYRF